MTAKPQPAGSWSGDSVPSPVIVKIPIVLGGWDTLVLCTALCHAFSLLWPGLSYLPQLWTQDHQASPGPCGRCYPTEDELSGMGRGANRTEKCMHPN